MLGIVTTFPVPPHAMRILPRVALALLLLSPGVALAQRPGILDEVKKPAREAPATPPLTDSLLQRYQQAALRALMRSEHSELIMQNLNTGNGAQLSARGLARLTSEQLERRARIRLALMDEADVRICAAWSTGTATPDIVVPVLAHADSAALDEWMDLAMAAAAAELRQAPERAAYDEDDVLLLFELIGRQLPGSDRKRFWRVVTAVDAGMASDAAACWLDRTIYRTALSLEPEVRGGALRTLIAIETDMSLKP